jgi:vancomycin resistance protein YoaR
VNLSLARVEESLLERTLQDVELSVVELTPDITAQMLDKITTRLSVFQTVFSTANEGRVHNIKTACSKIDQKVLLPGEVFSMDRALGDRTEKNGYKQAKVIINNELVDGLGGGICQVTSTFYNTVLLSGLEVVERRNHTLPLTYIEVGRDATISQGYIDFKFKNNLGYAIIIEANITGNQVSVAIWGRKPQTGNKIRIRTKIIEKTEAEGMETLLDPSLKPGEQIVVREAVPGCKVEVYRETVDASGKVIQTEKISVDKYLPQKKKMRVSPISAIDTDEGEDSEIAAQEDIAR